MFSQKNHKHEKFTKKQRRASLKPKNIKQKL